MLLRISVVYLRLVTLNALWSDTPDDDRSEEYIWQHLDEYRGYWPRELKLMARHHFANKSLTTELSHSPGADVVPKANHSEAPFLLPIYALPTERLFTGSVVSNKAVLTTCSTTVVSVGGGRYLYVKAEQLLVFLNVTINGHTTPVMTGVMEVRRHPTCDEPYIGKSWKNDVALLLLPVVLTFERNLLEAIDMPTLDFFEIYSAINKNVLSNTTCFAVFMKYRGEHLPKVKTWVPVKIRKSSSCSRTCGYLIDHCTEDLGGYSIHLVNANETYLEGSAHGAAIVCDGRIFGVLTPRYTKYPSTPSTKDTKSCGSDLFGHLPKPEAMLYLYVNFAEPNSPTKPIDGRPRSGSDIAVFSTVLGIALLIKSIL